jgi:hypothetical protein
MSLWGGFFKAQQLGAQPQAECRDVISVDKDVLGKQRNNSSKEEDYEYYPFDSDESSIDSSCQKGAEDCPSLRDDDESDENDDDNNGDGAYDDDGKSTQKCSDEELKTRVLTQTIHGRNWYCPSTCKFGKNCAGLPMDSFSLHWTFGRDSGETSVKEHRRAPEGRRRYAAFWRKVVILVASIFALDMRRRIPMR